MTDHPTYHFIFFGLTSFHSLPQREQALAVECALQGHRVDFIEIPPSMAGRTQALMHRVFSPLSRDRGFAHRGAPPGLTIHTPPTLPTGFRNSLTPAVDRGMFRRWFRRRFAGTDFSRSIAMVMLPLWWGSLVDRRLIDPQLLVYDVCDALDVQARTGRALRRLRMHERMIAAEADLVTYSAHEMEDDIRARFPQTDTLLLPNAVSQRFLALMNGDRSRAAADERRPVIGYVGVTYGKWFDTELFFSAVERFPECAFVVAGPVDRAFAERCTDSGNVTLHGFVPHEELPQLLQRFDVAIIPFLRNGITRVVNPLKLYEYAAAGLPVVATGVEELRHYPHVARLTHDREDFLEAVEGALRSRDADDGAARRRFAEENTWQLRVRQLLGHINQQVTAG